MSEAKDTGDEAGRAAAGSADAQKNVAEHNFVAADAADAQTNVTEHNPAGCDDHGDGPDAPPAADPDGDADELDDGLDEPYLAVKTATAFDKPSDEERIENRPPLVRAARRSVTFTFGVWTKLSADQAKRMHWIPRVEPYAGYATGDIIRLICRTTYAPSSQDRRPAHVGIRQVFMVPAGHVRVGVSIDGAPVHSMQVGTSELFDVRDPAKVRGSASIFSDSQGYLDLLIERELAPGIHDVEYSVAGRRPVRAQLMAIPADTPFGVISDVDDTIMVTNVPKLWSATFNVLFQSPYRRRAVPGMPQFYQAIRRTFPDAPFFYLSTSPWNVESSVRHLIRANGYPQGPMLLRDLDPRPKTFVPGGVQHKMEFTAQLMNDFPAMRFILIGDDGQSDPSTYSRIAREYPGRVAAIGIRHVRSQTVRAPETPQTDVPVFYGESGQNLTATMMPYLRTLAAEEKSREETTAADGGRGTECGGGQ